MSIDLAPGMIVCVVCHEVQAAPSTDGPQAMLLYNCCESVVCSLCLAPTLTKSLPKCLFHRLRRKEWVDCPAGCGDVIEIGSAEHLRQIFTASGVPLRDIDMHVGSYAQALAIRAKLLEVAGSNLEPMVANIAHRIYTRLEAVGISRYMFNHPKAPIEVELFEMETFWAPNGSEVELKQIPVITSLFFRDQPKTCTICIEERCEALLRYREDWEEVRNQFPGIEDVVEYFPLEAVLPACAASHSLDVCRECISAHVSAQIDQRGPSVIRELRCPSADCGHVFGQNELEDILSSRMYDKYVEASVRSAIADEPGFRWCLRPGCDSGAIYDTSSGVCEGVELSEAMQLAVPPAERVPDRITCGKCGLAMCFEHGTRWHRGLTCEEYSQLAAGGADTAENEAWLVRNTKLCPGCGVRVEKGNYCFHMTCSRCKAEWCWECGADWNAIWAPEGYNVEAHSEGCIFRNAAMPRPQFVHGETIDEALVRAERRENPVPEEEEDDHHHHDD